MYSRTCFAKSLYWYGMVLFYPKDEIAIKSTKFKDVQKVGSWGRGSRGQ